MAQAPNQPGGGAPFVREIVADPNNVPDVTLLFGYLGASSEEGHERLYLSPDLTNYVEIPKSGILHQMAAAKEQDPHGGVTLWVKKDAKLIYKMAPAAQALANYFRGAIAGGGAAAAAAGPQPMPPATILPAQCPPITLGGPLCTQGNTCGIDCSVVCPTRHVTCPAGCGVDSLVLCPTHRAPCPTHQPHLTCVPNCTHATCGFGCTVQNTQCAGVTCGIDCSVVGPCLTAACTQHRTPCPQATCGGDCTLGPGCPTHHVSCLPACQTRVDPQCPFPTEVTCAPVCHTRMPQCAQPEAVADALRCAGGTVAQFTPACPTWGLCPSAHISCFMSCHPCHTFINVSCNTCFGPHCLPVPTPPWTPTPTPTPWRQGPAAPQVDAFGAGRAWSQWLCGTQQCTGVWCHTPAHPCTPHCPM